MKIGIGEQPRISKQVLKLLDLIELKKITPDNFKKFLRYKKRLLLHLQDFLNKKRVFLADDEIVDLLNKKEIKKIIKSSSFPWFSLHFGLPVKKWKLAYHENFVALAPPISKKSFYNKISQNLQNIIKNYPNFKILLETPPLLPDKYSKGAFSYIYDPDFINKVLVKNNCYFLFDIAHYTIAALNLGYKDPKDFFEKLPLDKIIEIHIHRPIYDKKLKIWRDAHLPITDKEMQLLKWVLNKAKNVQAIILEAQGLHKEEILIKELKILKSSQSHK